MLKSQSTMDIYWGGQALFRIKGKQASVVIDPFDESFTGLKLPKDLSADIVLTTHAHDDHNNVAAIPGVSDSKPMIFSGPGEYEVKGVVVTGISSFHDNKEGAERGLNTIFHINLDGMDIVHLGDFGQGQLSEQQVAQIGQTDILLIPVGSIYTIDAKSATDVVSQLEPKIIIPMHYYLEGLKFQLDGAEKFLKEMGTEGVTPQPKLSITKEKLPEEPQVILLAKSS